MKGPSNAPMTPTRFRWPHLAAVLLAQFCFVAAPTFAQSPEPAPNAPVALPSPEQSQVARVRLVSAGGQVLQLPPGMPLETGATYDAQKVRDAIRYLYRTGRFSDIRVEATPVANGEIQLDFVVTENYYINEVSVLGLREPPSPAVALSALRLNLGEIYSPDKVDEGLQRLREVFREEGFYNPDIRVETAPDQQTRQINIIVHTQPGQRARIGQITVTNQTGFTDKKLLDKANLETGKEATSQRLDRAAERARNYLIKQGYLDAHVAVRRGEFQPQEVLVPLTVEFNAGPKVIVDVVGTKIPKDDLRGLLPIYQEHDVDQDLLIEGRRNIRAYLERQGYFDSIVDYSITPDAVKNEQHIIYTIERGPKRKLVGFEMVGNTFPTEFLRSRVRIQPAAFLAPGIFSQRLLEDSEQSIRALLQAQGYRDAQVRSEVIEGYQNDPENIFVRFHVEEGSQTRISEFRLEGNNAIATDFLLAEAIDYTEGQPYSEFNIASDRNNILAHYFNEGFPEARFEAQVDEIGPNQMRVTYQIFEGRQVRIEDILLDGYQHTRREVIAREVTLAPGGPLRQEDLLESQRQLYNLGIFSRVQIAPQNPQGTETAKTMVVLVEEAKRYTMAYGGGFEVQRLGSADDPTASDVRFSPRGLFEISKANFAGRAHTVGLKLRASSLQGRALVTYGAPKFMGHNDLSLLITGLGDKTRDVRTFSSQRYEYSAQLNHFIRLERDVKLPTARFFDKSTFLYRYAYRRVLVDPESLRVSQQEIPLFSQPTKISLFGVTWIRDQRREDPTDPDRGNFINADASIAMKSIGSSASFARFFLQHSSYHRINRRLVFARSARLGLQEPLGNTVLDDIPLPERFFAGGGNSLRGFGLNQAGPRHSLTTGTLEATGFPVGGLAMVVFNQELRFPFPRLPYVGDKLGGAIFYDGGNVFRRADKFTLRWKPSEADIQSGDLAFFSHTIGIGFRYGTPVGPVRLDIGYLLNPPEFRVQPPMMGETRERLPRLQFFFSIGSIF